MFRPAYASAQHAKRGKERQREAKWNSGDLCVSLGTVTPEQAVWNLDEIAYLGRDSHDRRRWARSEGLPAYCLLRHKLGSVYAYAAELDVGWGLRAHARVESLLMVETNKLHLASLRRWYHGRVRPMRHSLRVPIAPGKKAPDAL